MISRSLQETHALAARIASGLLPGEVIALIGDLGAGKTSFVQGLARGLGVDERAYVRSPTFTLVNEYAGRIPLYHIDLYRLDRRAEAHDLGLEEYFDGDGVTVVEWADRFPELLPERAHWITFSVVDQDSRRIEGDLVT